MNKTVSQESKKVSQTKRQIERIGAGLDGINIKISQLSDILSPILTPELPPSSEFGDSKKEIEAAPDVVIANQLYALSREARSIEERLNILMCRVDV